MQIPGFLFLKMCGCCGLYDAPGGVGGLFFCLSVP